MFNKYRLVQFAIFIKTPDEKQSQNWKIFYTSYTKIASIYYYWTKMT